MYPWPHQDGAGPEIIEGGPRRGAPSIVATAVAGAVVLAFSLTLTLAFAAVVGVGGRKGRGRQRTRWFLLWWAWRQLLLWRALSS
jgi:hypothetical protein